MSYTEVVPDYWKEHKVHSVYGRTNKRRVLISSMDEQTRDVY